MHMKFKYAHTNKTKSNHKINNKSQGNSEQKEPYMDTVSLRLIILSTRTID